MAHSIRRVLLLKKVSFFENIQRAQDYRRVNGRVQEVPSPKQVGRLEGHEQSTYLRRPRVRLTFERAKNGRLDEKMTVAHHETAEAWHVVQSCLALQPHLQVRVVEDVKASHAAWAHLIVSVGGDGTLLRASKAIRDGRRTLLMGVNSSPSSSVGFFCAATAKTFAPLFQQVLAGMCTYALHMLISPLVIASYRFHFICTRRFPLSTDFFFMGGVTPIMLTTSTHGY
jgi:hypothetical protein